MMRCLIIVAGLFLVGTTPYSFAMVDESDLTYDAFKQKANQPIRGKFTFVRVQYDSVGGYGESWYTYEDRDWERWETDYPDADENFLFRLSELTTIKPNPRAIVRRLTDPDIFDYPFLYMCDVGWMSLTEEEKLRLREYLQRGGFLWVDDFWGYAEWDNFDAIMRDVLPETPWQDLPTSHPVFNMVFPLAECPMIPARVFAVQGWTTEPAWIHKSGGLEEAHCRGYVDKNNRLMVLATHNTDIGDGFEREAEGEWYFEKYSTKAYAMGINIVVYALTH